MIRVRQDKTNPEGIADIGLRVPENEMPVLCRNEGQMVVTVRIRAMGSLGGAEVNISQGVIREIGKVPGKDKSL
jgi:hypothetical protein